MKGYAIQLGFTGESASRLSKAFEILDSPVLAVGGTPHLSLAVFSEDKREAYIAAATRLAAAMQLESITIEDVGSFPGEGHVTYLAATLDVALKQTHEQLHAILKEQRLESWSYYTPGSWTPHITLSMEDEQKKEQYLKQVPEMNLYGTLQIGSIRIIEFRPVIILKEIPVGAPELRS